MRRSVVAVLVALVLLVIGALPAAADRGRTQLHESLPHSQAECVCISDQHAKRIPLATALENCAVSLVGPNGERVGTGLSEPYGGFLGHGDTHYYSDVSVACGSGDPSVSEDGGTPATKA